MSAVNRKANEIPKPRAAPGWGKLKIASVGHSTRPLEELVAMLEAHGIGTLIDVRTIPRSRHNPQFNPETLEPALQHVGMSYVHLRDLGGLRHARKGDPTNAAWRNASFRGFADYMQTDDFTRGLEALRVLAKSKPVAMMCAEAVPWRCHRSLISDALFARGVIVAHLDSATRSHPHKPTPFARIEGRRVTYPAENVEPQQEEARS